MATIFVTFCLTILLFLTVIYIFFLISAFSHGFPLSDFDIAAKYVLVTSLVICLLWSIYINYIIL